MRDENFYNLMGILYDQIEDLVSRHAFLTKWNIMEKIHDFNVTVDTKYVWFF